MTRGGAFLHEHLDLFSVKQFNDHDLKPSLDAFIAVQDVVRHQPLSWLVKPKKTKVRLN